MGCPLQPKSLETSPRQNLNGSSSRAVSGETFNNLFADWSVIAMRISVNIHTHGTSSMRATWRLFKTAVFLLPSANLKHYGGVATFTYPLLYTVNDSAVEVSVAVFIVSFLNDFKYNTCKKHFSLCHCL